MVFDLVLVWSFVLDRRSPLSEPQSTVPQWFRSSHEIQKGREGYPPKPKGVYTGQLVRSAGQFSSRRLQMH
jgi:hypothetical protein